MATKVKTSAPRNASPPCSAANIVLVGDHYVEIDPEAALDVARWRSSKRRELLAARAGLSVASRQDMAAAVVTHLKAALARHCDERPDLCLSLYWPIKSELDIRALAEPLHRRGIRLALPVVEEKDHPLAFYLWQPGDAMVRGYWNIPVPARIVRVRPTHLLAPLVGWDRNGYRLGYGGGYFDRTLALFNHDFHAIGIGLRAAEVQTIFPQPFDIPLHEIITEYGSEALSRPDPSPSP